LFLNLLDSFNFAVLFLISGNILLVLSLGFSLEDFVFLLFLFVDYSPLVSDHRSQLSDLSAWVFLLDLIVIVLLVQEESRKGSLGRSGLLNKINSRSVSDQDNKKTKS